VVAVGLDAVGVVAAGLDTAGVVAGGSNGTWPVVMACSTLYISTGGVIRGPGTASPPPPAENAAVPRPTTKETVPSIR
jgi:hypothetical protein